MTREEAMRIMKEEDLRHYNLFEETRPKKWDLVINRDGERWVVYKISERMAMDFGTERYFDEENDAWDNFIRRLRAGKELEESTNGKYY